MTRNQPEAAPENKPFDVCNFDIARYNKILKNGLSSGMGTQNGQMCIEAAICTVMGEGFNDHPKCVDDGLADFKINLNDSAHFKNAKDRAKCLKQIGLAQLGTNGLKGIHNFIPMLSDELKGVWNEMVLGFLKEERSYTPEELCLISKSLKGEKMNFYEREYFENMDPLDSHYNSFEEYWEMKGEVPPFSSKAAYKVAAAAVKVLRKLKSPGVKLLDKAVRKGLI